MATRWAHAVAALTVALGLCGEATAGDEPIQRALTLFSAQELATMPRVVPATVMTGVLTGDVEGYVVPGYPVIYIATWSDTYKGAANGDRNGVIKLAAVIAHERAHVEHGPDERAAYAAEIFMLRRSDAPTAMIDGVHRAMRAIGVSGQAAAGPPSIAVGTEPWL